MQNVTTLCNAVMRGVASGISGKREIADYNQATEVMRAEIKALLTGDEYKDARECVLNGTMHERYVIGLVVANCISKINFKE